MLEAHDLFRRAIDKKASDIHLVSERPVMLRIDGILVPDGEEVLKGSDIDAIIESILSPVLLERFRKDHDVDASHTLGTGERLRINCHSVGGSSSLAARIIPREIPTIESLGIPDVVLPLCTMLEGLILFTGPTGSGKSTSLAAILQRLSQASAINVITLEDPVEFTLPHGSGIVRQRELGIDFPSFPEGLKHVLRQDPDVVMVGEMRDMESIALALTLAETGHLVLATLHTPNTVQAIDRIIDVFPSHQQSQVRLQLSLSLKAIIGQRLIPAKNGGRIANREILIRNAAVGSIIREHRLAELESVLQTGASEGMITFDMDLKRLKKAKLIDN